MSYYSGGTAFGWRTLVMRRCSCVNVTGAYSVSLERSRQCAVGASLARCVVTCSF